MLESRPMRIPAGQAARHRNSEHGLTTNSIDNDPPRHLQAPWSDGAGVWKAFWYGTLAFFRVPGIVLFSTALGFGAYAHDSGFTLGQTAFVSVTIFALPGQVVLVDQVAHGAALVAMGFAVTLTAIRLLPMVVVFVPYIRNERADKLPLLCGAHFIAVTAWVLGTQTLPHLPKRLRLANHLGVGIALTTSITIAAMIGHQVSGVVPPVIAGGLLFLTPIYFMLSLIGSVMVRTDQMAIAFGLILGAPVYLLVPEFDLLATGLIGGTLAYAIGRLMAAREQK